MFINNFDPVAIEIFSFEIRWYSLAYVLGILIGWFLAKKIFITDDGLKEKFDDYLTFAILGIIIGGRIGYILLYNFNYYADIYRTRDPYKILKFKEVINQINNQ